MPLRKLMLVASAALTVGVTACATPTPYQPRASAQASSTGFSEQRLESDRFRVAFAGNTLTSRETVERYLLYRAAELTRQQGYDWFETADRRTDTKSQSYIEPDPFMRPGFSYGLWRPAWRYYGPRYGGWRTWDPYLGDPFFMNRAQVRTVQKFEATTEIVMHKGPKPGGDARAFDAGQVIDNLGPTIKRPA